MLRSNICGCPLICFETLDSTNTYIKSNIASLEDRTVVIADKQSDGRGRHGNSWLADSGTLTFSVLFKNPENPLNITLISAVAVCRAIEKIYGATAQIKWTNDVICEHNKVCGILCESTLKGSSSAYVICGIGINVNQGEDFFKDRNLPHAASLNSLCRMNIEKFAVAENVVENLLNLYCDDFSVVLDEYRKRCLTLGKMFKILSENKEITACAKDIDDD